MYDLKGQVAIVTGGASGIGRAIAMRLAEEGCKIGVLDMAEAEAAQTVDRITGAGGEAMFAPCDVTARSTIDDGVASLTSALGPADILVNSAGVLRVGGLLDQPYEDFDIQFRVNVDGIFHACQAVVPGMIERGGGNVVNIASWLGKRAVKCYGGYCATKFAIIGLTQALALETAATGVRVNAICPGPIVDTRMREQAEAIHKRLRMPSAEERAADIPLGRLGQPDDIARLAAFLVSNQAAFMTGQAINVTGGHWLS
ncbi:SDR family NAD(P)-dependent oxidoreductase [Marinivivus vitaminiproducens]|uniref:SDR family NAD(P)-dependent oxidoreductase n=1 Tax=Marinivivus vitaminiproducens TaxID=3035935 RepID=UPI0027AAAAF2|nr:SDR family NAD(P)-dependent oxidoreductase [Geminicoccaceae bacterium SCSIO 64248]